MSLCPPTLEDAVRTELRGETVLWSSAPARSFGNRIFYVITESRAIIFKKVWRLQIQSFETAVLGGFERISFGGRAGDLIFRRELSGGKRDRTIEFGFLGLESFAEPEAILLDLVKRKNGQRMRPQTMAENRAPEGVVQVHVSVSDTLVEAIRRETASETILWSDGPVAHDYKRRNWVKMPTTIFFLLMGLLFLWMAISAQRAWFLWAVVLLCLCAAVESCLTPRKSLERLQTLYYIITDQRVIFFETAQALKVHSLGSSSLKGYEKILRKRGFGDLVLYCRIGSGIQPPRFCNIASMDKAESALQQLMGHAPPSLMVIH